MLRLSRSVVWPMRCSSSRFCALLLALGGVACTVEPPPSGGADDSASGEVGVQVPDEESSGGSGGSGSESTTEPPPPVRLDLDNSMNFRMDLANNESGDTCPDVTVEVQATVPTVLLMLDQSFSMTDGFAGIQSRWDAVEETLFDPTTGVVWMLDEQVSFGMTLYSAFGVQEMTDECPRLISEDAAFGNAAVLADAYAAEDPFGDTPTGESLDAIIPTFATVESSGPKVIVLATDGEPDTCAQPLPDDGQVEALAAAERAFAAGLPLFIISVGDDVGADHLQDMANVGVGKPVDDPDPAPYYQALDPAELVDAFLSIIGGLVSCDFQINGAVDPDGVCEGEVTVNGAPIECGTDWSVTGESTLSLLGEACENLKSGMAIEISAKWPCDVVRPIG